MSNLDRFLDATVDYSNELEQELSQDAESLSRANNFLPRKLVKDLKLSRGCTLTDYHAEGVKWLVSLYESGASGILADETGLG